MSEIRLVFKGHVVQLVDFRPVYRLEADKEESRVFRSTLNQTSFAAGLI